jgi:hypothetical protein
MFAADSLYRLRLIEYAQQRGISDQELALATKEQGDLLGIHVDLAAEGSATRDLASAARAAGIPDELCTELADILAIEDTAAAGGLQAIDIADPASPAQTGWYSPTPLPLVANGDPAPSRGPDKVVMRSYPIIATT